MTTISKRSWGLTAMLLCGLALPAAAQTPARVPTPNDTLRSPEVHADGRVTFRIYAPKASEVTVSGDWIAQGRGTGGKLERNGEGVWSLTVGPLVPDLYAYTLMVDGVRTADPRNAQIKQGISTIENIVEVPGAGAEFMANQAGIPHGRVQIAYYPSRTLGTMRSMRVYTPAGYESGSTRYPVFYLLHGGGDDDSGWSTIGRANFILDNLIASGKAKPMIVVMPNGSMPRPAAGAATGPAAMTAAQARFRDELLHDVIPFVEGSFRVIANRESRAIAGLSMGGGQTMAVVPSNLDRFAYVGVWSAGLNPANNEQFRRDNAQFLQADRTNRMLKHFQVAVGSTDFALNGSKNLAQLLSGAGIRHQYVESEGGHTWINWRRYLNEFAPLLFR